jgi:aspartyl-tRNA(Asn)/glutamyl-tRNA(Gln) amidotransferase subunit B
MHSAKDASAYSSSLRAIMQYLEIAKCNMEEGGMRMDVNISVRPKGEVKLRPCIEIKNLNSFHNMELAIESEIRRQIIGYTQNPHTDHEEVIRPGTYRFDLESRQTIIMRSKEKALDYRYFHEPDLPPIVLKKSTIEKIRLELPELPYQRYLRYIKELKLPVDRAAVLVNDKYSSDFFEKALTLCGNATSLANWIIVEFYGRLKEKGLTLRTSGLKSEFIGRLVKLIEEKVITGRIAKQVADDMLENPNRDPQEIISSSPDYRPVNDTEIIEPIIDQVLQDHVQSIIDYRSGRKKALAFLVGQVMKQTQGKASPNLVNKLILSKIENT